MLKDKDIREPLFDFLEEQYGKTRIIEEKTMGKSRADVVMVLEEELVGIEIKRHLRKTFTPGQRLRPFF